MKKILFIFIIVSLINTNFVWAEEPKEPETKLNENTAQYFQKYVKTPFGKFIKSTDKFRLALGAEFKKKVDYYKAQKQKIIDNTENLNINVENKIKDDTLDTSTTYVSSVGGNPLSLIWISILIYLFFALTFIFTTAYVFYLILGLVVFLTLRFIWEYLL